MLGRFVGRLVVCGFRGPWIGSAKNLFVDESGLEGLVGLTGLTTLGIFTTGIVLEEVPGLVAIFLILDNDPEIEDQRETTVSSNFLLQLRPFKMGTSLKEKNLLPEGANPFLYE